MVRLMWAEANLSINIWKCRFNHNLQFFAQNLILGVCVLGVVHDVHSIFHKYEKSEYRAKKCVLIKYLECSKGLMMFTKGVTLELESRDMDFLENEFLIISEMKKDLKFYELEEASMHIIHSHSNEYVPYLYKKKTERVIHNLVEVFN